MIPKPKNSMISIDELKEILRHLGLNEDGEKEELVGRLSGATSVSI